jgi:hypothetical protein
MGELAREQGELSSKQTNDDMERVDYSESNYDSFSGYSEGLFAGGNYEDDDREADLIYQSVDQCLEKRHKRSRELQLLADSQKKQKEAATISEQFADLKQGLSEVSSEMWDAIPEVGDHSLKTKMQRKNKGVSFMPLPDSVVTQAGASGVGLSGNTLASVDVSGDAGAGTPAGGAITGLSGARGTVLSLKLDRMSDSVSGQTVVDPRGYLTEMSGIKIRSVFILLLTSLQRYPVHIPSSSSLTLTLTLSSFPISAFLSPWYLLSLQCHPIQHIALLRKWAISRRRGRFWDPSHLPTPSTLQGGLLRPASRSSQGKSFRLAR